MIADPQVLFSRIGPQIPCRIPGTKVRLEAFGEDSEVNFDVNTVQPAIMRMIPGITAEQVQTWLSQRPYASAEDFRKRSGVTGLQF